MEKFNLFIVGPPRTGTTSLFEYLRTHPEIFIPDMKEIHFFSDVKADIRNMKEYQKLIKGRGEKILVDVSPDYFFWKDSPKKIKNYNKKAKIIIIERDPNECLKSLLRKLLLHKSGWKILDKFPIWDVYNYKTNIERYKKQFSKHQILLLSFNKLKNSPEQVYSEILNFLKLRDDGRKNFPVYNKNYSYKFKKLVGLMTKISYRKGTLKRLLGSLTPRFLIKFIETKNFS